MPRMWFAQFEAVIASQKQGDATKYNLVVAKLGRESLQQVSDIVTSPPDLGKYEVLKQRLLTVFEESAERQFQKLVGEMDLGTQRPTQLLRRMKELARNTHVSDEAVKNLWLARLPSSVRAVLTVSQDAKLENLATMADRIVENLRVGEVAEVSTRESNDADLLQQMSKLTMELQQLRGEVNAIRGRSLVQGNRWGRRNSRSKSRSSVPRRTPDSPDWLCKFHYRFRERANRCESPCNWQKKQGN